MNIKRIILLLSCLGIAVAAPAAVAVNLSGVIVYPNPFEPAKGHTAVSFANLTETARIRVYNLAGEQVFDQPVETLASDGLFTWGATNSGGQALASGLYFYLVTNDSGQKVSGKLVIER